MPSVTKQSPNATLKSPSKAPSVIDRIKGIEFEEEGLKLLVYGRSGTGKTTFWSTFPGPILCIVCSGGSKPGELRSIDTPELRKKIQTVTLEKVAEMETLLRYVEEEKKFKTVILDHASGFQDMTLKEILGLEELPVTKSWGTATQEEYGRSTTQCKESFRRMLSLSGNVILVAQEREFKVEGAEDIIRPTIGAALTPALTGWLNPACDYVVQTFIRPRMEKVVSKIGGKDVVTWKRGKGVDYCVRTEPHDVYATKFRVPKGHPLPDSITNPSYEKIMAIIQGKTPVVD